MASDATTTVTTSPDPPFWFYVKLKRFAGEKISGFERKSFTRHNSKVSGFKVPTLDTGFKISENHMTKPGSFYFGFIHKKKLFLQHKFLSLLAEHRTVTTRSYFCNINRDLLAELVVL